MVKLLNKIFGWHYIIFPFGVAYIERRVKAYPNGLKYVEVCDIRFIVNKDGTLTESDGRKRKYKPITWKLEE